MLKNQVGKRVAAGFTAAILASAMMVPAVAFGEENESQSNQQKSKQPEVLYDGEGGAETELHLILDTDLGPTNKEDTTGNTKVVVPSKLTFVAKADGTITGPAFDIKNYSKFKVHVSKVGVEQKETDKSGVGTINADGTTDNTVKIAMTPASGSEHNLAEYLTAKAPKEGEWNINPASGDAAELLNVKTSGKFNKLSSIVDDSAHKFGTITWTVAPGHKTSQAEASTGGE